MEETIAVSMEEYQRMKEAVRSIERGKGEEQNGKSVVEGVNKPQV